MLYQEPSACHDLGHMDRACSHCGALHWVDKRLARSSKTSLKFTSCCNGREIHLLLLELPPEALLRLFCGQDLQSCEFRQNIWQYNAALAFTSLGVKIDNSVTGAAGGLYIFCIKGELCHQIGAFEPHKNESPSYAQLYLYDPQAALDQRMDHNRNLRADTIELLQNPLHTYHHYVGLYHHAYEILAQYPNVDDISVHLWTTETQDHCHYNLPMANEMAVIILGDGSQVWDTRDIIIRQCDDSLLLHQINDGHLSYASLHYVLLFPQGKDSWHWNLKQHQPPSAKLKIYLANLSSLKAEKPV